MNHMDTNKLGAQIDLDPGRLANIDLHGPTRNGIAYSLAGLRESQ